MVQESPLEQRVEIANPQHPHCATVLVVDTSSSMSGDKIRQLRPGTFREMFTWLSTSQQRVSVSRVGEQVPLDDPTGPSGWAEIATT